MKCISLCFSHVFSDSFSLFYTEGTGTNESVNLLDTGIAWKSDHSVKFNNPASKCFSLQKLAHAIY